MINMLLDAIQSLKNWRKMYAKACYYANGDCNSAGAVWTRNHCDMVTTQIRRMLRDMHGEDYTAALDLLADEFGSYVDFI